jgi:hypothetical protein
MNLGSCGNNNFKLKSLNTEGIACKHTVMFRASLHRKKSACVQDVTNIFL